ncbi:ATP-grasp domain-containing protein [Mucilaginibacter sp. FT3.2]|uniref:ATP-grasp domain-containing protein n=1 Tax=Mucilaginibacter sp. FT3.2 TaxID=2723090 RepID=UPI00160C0E2C|nr:ATP-grasp domain-containing protein [Mucilaginibacter sp. FT3.2]MBB6232579.1 glutathione synthase/RimK-type ligase-like ATP-grasp enzyme [Mucilaginibacter sp. FT3.2]
MIILMGIPSETPLRLLAEACNAKRIPYEFFNQRQQENWTVDYNFRLPAEGVLDNGTKRLKLNDCTGLYLRAMDHTQIPEYAQTENKEGISNMYEKLFQLIDNESACKITNPPSVQMSNNSKPYQSLIIQQHGLDIPDMCITSDEDEAREFIAKYKTAIYKSISGTRSIVKQVDEASLQNLHKIKYCPVQFQECVTGFNVRVHVVGQIAIATKICSDAVDYRYASAEGKNTSLEPYQLPANLAEKCVALAHQLHLPFAGIDLMITDDGRTICFEVNPSPGYTYYEQNTGQLISHALADYLAN